MSSTWTAPTSLGEACRRAGGRRRYNALRQDQRDQRRAQILLRTMGQRDGRGVQAQLARELGVSRGTISRDFAALRDAGQGALLRRKGSRSVAHLSAGRNQTATAPQPPSPRPALVWAELSAVELLAQVHALGYRLSLRDGQLVLQATADRPAALVAALRRHASELRALLSPAPPPAAPDRGAPLQGCAIRVPSSAELDLLRMFGIFGR